MVSLELVLQSVVEQLLCCTLSIACAEITQSLHCCLINWSPLTLMCCLNLFDLLRKAAEGSVFILVVEVKQHGHFRRLWLSSWFHWTLATSVAADIGVAQGGHKVRSHGWVLVSCGSWYVCCLFTFLIILTAIFTKFFCRCFSIKQRGISDNQHSELWLAILLRVSR